MKINKTKIIKDKLILAEGVDAYYFLIWALQAYSIEDTQVMDFGGIEDLSKFIRILKNIDGFDSVKSIVIARDAETNHSAAFSSVTATLRNNDLPVPDSVFLYKNGTPRTAIMLFPGYNSQGEMENGCLENLCLKTVNDNTISTTEKYLESVNQNHEKLSHEHKSLLHAYLAVKNKFVGSKLGEAAKFGAWDWDSTALIPFKNLLEKG